MSAPDTSQERQQSPPEEMQPSYPTIAPNTGELLFWSLDGPLTSAISVMSRPSPTASREPYYNQSTGTWHPISKQALTVPKVNFITTRAYELEQWDESWCDQHWDNARSDPEAEGVKWETLPSDDDEEGMLLMCYVVEQPLSKNAMIAVRPTVQGTEAFVTVHDYLSVVHPWLMSLRGDILAAMTQLDQDHKPFGEETQLMVSFIAVEILMIRTRAEWLEEYERERLYTTAPDQA